MSLPPDFKFILVPGWVTSKSDDERHFVDINRLAALYGLQPGEYTGSTVPAERRRLPKHWIELGPRYHGDYAEFIATVRSNLDREAVTALV